MKRRIFDTLRPVCPRCSQSASVQSPLVIDRVDRTDGDDIIDGSLCCVIPSCRQEYPVIDGIPVLVPDVRSWVQANQWDIFARKDLSPMTESLIGDCLEPGSSFNVSRQHLSIYCADHYGVGDSPDAAPSDHRPAAANAGSSVHNLLQDGLADIGMLPAGPILDLGCSVGGSTFRLAEAASDRVVIGMDLSWGMLRVGRDALTDGKVTYSLRDIGLVYRRCTRPVDNANGERMDFWIGDALWPPFAPETFGMVVALNLLDCVTSPVQALGSIDALLKRNGRCLLATPFDWSATATPVEGWIGGHSQRGPDGGLPEARLRALLADGASPLPGLHLTLDQVRTKSWRVRLHGRCSMEYATDLYTLRAQ